jgi:hypothetical protein
MSVTDLVFTKSTGTVVYGPDLLTTSNTYTVTNMGSEDLTDLGLFITSATNVGDVDDPADYAPETDYQDLLTWGTNSDNGVTVQGGIKVTVPQNGGGSFSGYITRSVGATVRTKVPFRDLVSGASVSFTVEFEVPSGVASRRFFVNIVLE